MLPIVCRGGGEFLAPDRVDALLPINLELIHQRRRERFVDAAVSQFRTNFQRAVTARDAVVNVGFSETAVVLEPFGGEALKLGVYVAIVEPLGAELSLEFDSTVFAARKRGDRYVANSPRGFVAQASASRDSSSSSVSTTAASGRACARTPASISPAISLFSLSRSRTFSLPCPKRSPL